MKLVDILARELKVWPEGLECLSQLKGTGYIINGKGFDGRAFDALRIADETLVAGAIVTRAEWQAAVNALNAPKPKIITAAELLGDGYLTMPVSLYQRWGGRAYNFEKQPEWSEDGLPNVGTKCVIYKGTRGLAAGAEEFIGPVVTVTARFKSARGIEMACVDSGGDGGCHVFRADMCFHLPTAEEIAAEEREKAVAAMLELDPYLPNTTMGMMSRADFCRKLYDENYRKQVAK